MRLSTLLETVAVAALLTATSQAAMAQTVNGVISSFAAPTYAQEFSDYNTNNPSSPITFNTQTAKLDIGLSTFLLNAGAQFGKGQSADFAASDIVLPANSPVTTVWNATQARTAGNLTQLAMFGTPVALTFNGLPDGAGATATSLNLTEVQACGIFSGRINQVSALVPGYTGSATLSVAYRADNSGTTYLLTQHLAAMCGTPTSPGLTGQTEPVTFTATSNFTSLFHKLPSNFVAAITSDNASKILPGMRQQVMNHHNVIGYAGPNYTQIASVHAGDATYPLTAALTNMNSNQALLPDLTNTFNALDIGADEGIPSMPNPSRGYPIVGYTTWSVAQCYKDANTVAALQNFLFGHYNDEFDTDLNNNGFVAVPGPVYDGMVQNVLPTIQQGGTGACAGIAGR